jgi:hypothetical protein
MKTILKTLYLLVALTSAVPVFAQSDFETTKARAEAGEMYNEGDGVEQSDQDATKC